VPSRSHPADVAHPSRPQLAVLGPLEGRSAGAALALGSPQQQAVLAALVLREGAHAELSELIAGLWGEDAPASAAGTLRTYLSRLRRSLGPASGLLSATGGGYRLDRTGYDLDLTAFEQHRRQAAAATGHGDTAGAAEHLRAALALWRGTPLSGLPGPYAESQRARLVQLHGTVVEELLAAELELGHVPEVLGELTLRIADEPLRERLRELQVLALWRSGRQAEALAAYAEAREVLAEELGIDPGPALQALHQQVLSGAPPVAEEPVPAAPGAQPVPAQLPAEVAVLTGRGAALDRLTAAATGADAARVVVVSGMGGVGKTSLAVHFARLRAADHPDGALFVNLRGFDPRHPPLDPAEALRGFLEALGVAPPQVPVDVAARAALFRTLLDGRRAVVVLDNARDAEQVRPLLPGGTGTLVLVTSRNSLTGLVATAGAQPVPLDVLDRDAARQLLHRRLGPARAGADPGAVDRLVERTGGLPLALAVVAARATLQPGVPLAALADELGAGPLDAMATADDSSDLRAVLSPSYRALSPAAALVFRALAVQPGQEAGTAGVASTVGLPRGRTGALLRELSEAALVGQPRAGRWVLHDLLLAYALELTDPAEHRELVGRALAHLVHTAAAARQVFAPAQYPVELPPVPPDVVPEAFADVAAALAWFEVDGGDLHTAVARAVAEGMPREAQLLAWTAVAFHKALGRTADAVPSLHLALQVTDETGDPLWAGRLHRALAVAYSELERVPETVTHARAAVAAFRSHGDRALEAQALAGLAYALDLGDRPDPDAARVHLRAALAITVELGDRPAEAMYRNNLGWSLLRAGRPAEAERELLASAALSREDGDELTLAEAEMNLGRIDLARGRAVQALDRYQHAAATMRAAEDPAGEVEATLGLGQARWATGDGPGARRAWADALQVVDRWDPTDGVPAAQHFRRQLLELLARAGEPDGR
jgi:DNA-binding SARP family transcriptional activator/tetratricopeptide (TPR) repeat protein